MLLCIKVHCESLFGTFDYLYIIAGYITIVKYDQNLYLYFSASTNLANGKTTYSSTLKGNSHRPPEAVDGESNSYFQSSTSANQWWRVDLGGSYYVGVIRVYSSQCKTCLWVYF